MLVASAVAGLTVADRACADGLPFVDGFENNGLSAWSTGHAFAQTVAFTTTPPAAWLPRSATYSFTVVSSSGLPVHVQFGGECSPEPPTDLDGSTSFALSVAPAGTAGTCVLDATQAGNGVYAPAAPAQQSFGIDDTPPVLTVTSVYPKGGSGGPGVTYPVTVSGPGYSTGYDGSHYLFGDSVHVQASITDTGSGIHTGALQVRLDGLQPSGVATGTPVALTAAPPYDLQLDGCVDGATSCQIELDLPLGAQFEPSSSLSGNFGIVLGATDQVGNQGVSGSAPVAATRFWWSRTLSAGATVKGLAVHPDGDVIATTANASANADVVFGLYGNGPFDGTAATGCAAGEIPGVHWCVGHDFFGAADGLGSVVGAPAIGDDVNGQLIYLTSAGSKAVALDGSGAPVWWCNSGTSPAVDTPAVATLAGGPACEAMIFGSGSSKTLGALCGQSPGSCTVTSVSTGTKQPNGAPIVAGGTVFSGATSDVLASAMTSGALGTPTFAGLGASIDGLAFAAGQLYAASNATSDLYQLSTSLVGGFTAGFTPSAPQGLPILTGPNVVASDAASALRTVSTIASGSVTAGTILGLAHPVYTPLLGSDGRLYVGGDSGLVAAVDPWGSPAVSWQLGGVTANGFTVAPTMDCNGHLYAAAGDTVYAFLTDAHGLANTPWPKYQHDTRNSGNADRTASDGVPYGVYNGVSCVP